MKDESRELIEQYKDMYQKLNEQSIFSLRTYGREIGVAQPTLKKKEELIIHIKVIRVRILSLKRLFGRRKIKALNQSLMMKVIRWLI